MRLRLFCVLFIWILSISNNVYGKEPTVKLMLEVKDIYIDESEQNYPYTTVKITATIVNLGKRPALLFAAEEPMIVIKTIGASAKQTLPNSGYSTISTFPEIDDSEKWVVYAKSLKGHILKDSGLVMIPPEEKYSFTQAFNIPVSQSVFPNRATLSKIRRIHTIWLSIGIFTWPYNLERVEKSLGRKIRKKWRKAGDLILKPLGAEPVCLGNPNEWPVKR
jgi:hypothetical protein